MAPEELVPTLPITPKAVDAKPNIADVIPYLNKAVVRHIYKEPRLYSFMDTTHGAAVFCDISGFTALTDELKYLPDAAERISMHLNEYFSVLLRVIEEYGGDIAFFAGDAVLCVWPCAERELPTTTLRAIQCSTAILEEENKSDSRLKIKIQGGAEVLLSSHIGVACGALTAIVTGARSTWRYLLLGPAVHDACLMSSLAQRRELLLSQTAQRTAGDGLLAMHVYRGERTVGDQPASPSLQVPPRPQETTECFVFKGFTHHFGSIRDGVASSAWSDETSLRSKSIVSFQDPPAEEPVARHGESDSEIFKRASHFLTDIIWKSQRDCEGQLRMVSTIFIKLNAPLAIVTPDDADAIHKSFKVVVKELHHYDGVCNKMVMDDKGLVVLCVFGLPYHSHEDDVVRSVRFALELCKKVDKVIGNICVGISRSKAYCGNVGGALRREYTVIGTGVNTAARLMSHAAKFPKLTSQILCDEATYEGCELTQEFGFSEAVHIELKGIQEPVTAYQPLSADQGPQRSRSLSSKSSRRSLRSSTAKSLSRSSSRRSLMSSRSTADLGMPTMRTSRSSHHPTSPRPSPSSGHLPRLRWLEAKDAILQDLRRARVQEAALAQAELFCLEEHSSRTSRSTDSGPSTARSDPRSPGTHSDGPPISPSHQYQHHSHLVPPPLPKRNDSKVLTFADQIEEVELPSYGGFDEEFPEVYGRSLEVAAVERLLRSLKYRHSVGAWEGSKSPLVPALPDPPGVVGLPPITGPVAGPSGTGSGLAGLTGASLATASAGETFLTVTTSSGRLVGSRGLGGTRGLSISTGDGGEAEKPPLSPRDSSSSEGSGSPPQSHRTTGRTSILVGGSGHSQLPATGSGSSLIAPSAASSSGQPAVAGSLRVLILNAEPGMGKSVLLRKAAQAAIAAKVDCMATCGSPIETHTPFHGLRPILEDILETYDDDPIGFLDMLSLEERTLFPALTDVLPDLEIPGSLQSPTHLDAKQKVDAITRLSISLLQREYHYAPLLILVDDGQWVDSLTMNFLARVLTSLPTVGIIIGQREGPSIHETPLSKPFSVRSARSEPSLSVPALGSKYSMRSEVDSDDSDDIVLPSRTLFSNGSLAKLVGVQEMTLQPLNLADSVVLYAHWLRVREVEPPLAKLVHEKSDGNPGFGEQYLISLHDADFISLTENEARLTAELRDTEEVGVPSSIENLVTSRIDRLSTESSYVLKVASVIGRMFRPSLLARTLQRDQAGVQSDLDDLVQSGFLYWVGAAQLPRRRSFDRPTPSRGTVRRSSLREQECAFKLSVMSSVLYSHMLFRERKEIHHRVAELLEADGDCDNTTLALHFSKAGVVPKAVQYLDLASHDAVVQQQWHRCITLLSEAIAAVSGDDGGQGFPQGPPSPIVLARWHRTIADAHFVLGEPGPFVTHMQEAVRLLGCPETPLTSRVPMRKILYQTTKQLWHRVYNPVRVEASETVLQRCYALNTLCDYFYRQQQLDAFVWCALYASNVVDGIGLSTVRAQTYGWMALAAASRRRRWTSRYYFGLSNQLARLSEAASLRCFPSCGVYHLWQRDIPEFEELMATYVDAADRHGTRRDHMAVVRLSAIHRALGGRVAAALDETERGLTVAVEHKMRRDEVELRVWGAVISVYLMGDPRRASNHLEVLTSSSAVPTAEEGMHRVIIPVTAAYVSFLRERLPEAYTEITAVLPMLLSGDECTLLSGIATCMALHICTAQYTGNATRSLMTTMWDLLKHLRALGRCIPVMSPFVLLWEGRLTLCHNAQRTTRAVARWRESIALADRMSMPFVVAQAKLFIATLGVPSRGDQLALIEEVRVIYDSMGADKLVQHTVSTLNRVRNGHFA